MNSVIQYLFKLTSFMKTATQEMSTQNFKGVSMDKIYRNFDPWDLDHLPPVENTRNHTVLFQLPISKVQPLEPPTPHIGKGKWDSNHVRLPCASQNEYKTESSSDSSKSVTAKRWEIIETALLRDIRSSRELEQTILTYNHKYAKSWKFRALHQLFEQELSESEAAGFFTNTFPALVRLALQLPDIVPCAIPLLKQNQNKSISLTQQQIACLLANAFLCTFPRRNDIKWSSNEYANYPSINFSSLFQNVHNIEKIKCICNYFRRVCAKMPTGVVTFSRRSVAKTDFPKWNKCQTNFENALLYVSDEGTIEDDGEGFLQVDFANKYLGGGVLGQGCVQEEIRFVICPELLCSRLFTEYLADNECMVIMGFERFSCYAGYATTFEWTGDYNDDTPMDSFRRRKCALVAIDAIPFGYRSQQYHEDMLKREVNKAYVGFKHDLLTPAPGVATGNWGCGAFNGNKHLKSLLQLIACVVTERPLVYFTFGDEELRDELAMVYDYLRQSKMTVGELWSYLRQYAEQKTDTHLYEFIIACHQEPSEHKEITQTNGQSSTQANRSPAKVSPKSKQTPSKSTAKAKNKVEEDEFYIEDSGDEDLAQFSLSEAMEQLNEHQNELKSIPANPKRSPNRGSNQKMFASPTGTSSKQAKTIDNDHRPSRTIQSFLSKSEAVGETQEKRPRSSLLDSLDDCYNRKSPAKIKRNSEFYVKIEIPKSKCEEMLQPEQSTATADASEGLAQNSESIEDDTPELQFSPKEESIDEKDTQDPIEVESCEMLDDSIESEKITSKAVSSEKTDHVQVKNTDIPKIDQKKKTSPPMKGTDKSVSLFERYFNVSPAKRLVQDVQGEQEESTSSDELKQFQVTMEKHQDTALSSQDSPVLESEEQNASTQELMETAFCEELNSELNSETDHFKALNVTSSLTEDLKSPKDT